MRTHEHRARGDEAHSNSNEKKSEKATKQQMNASITHHTHIEPKHAHYRKDIRTKSRPVTLETPIHRKPKTGDNSGSRHLAREDLYTTSGGIADGKDLGVGLPQRVSLPHDIVVLKVQSSLNCGF